MTVKNKRKLSKDEKHNILFFIITIVIPSLFVVFSIPFLLKGSKDIYNNIKKSAVADEVELPPDYEIFGSGKFISRTEWIGEVIDCRDLTRIPGDSKDCNIYKIHLYGIGSDQTYTLEQVFEMNGYPSTIPYDGHTYG